MSLPGNDVEDARMADFEKAQEKFEEESEKLLMAVYDALYKVSLSPSPQAYTDLCFFPGTSGGVLAFGGTGAGTGASCGSRSVPLHLEGPPVFPARPALGAHRPLAPAQGGDGGPGHDSA
jgi:hypothetical protein